MVAGIDKLEEIDPSGIRKLLRLINPLRDSRRVALSSAS